VALFSSSKVLSKFFFWTGSDPCFTDMLEMLDECGGSR
jgi:hypothetical protein